MFTLRQSVWLFLMAAWIRKMIVDRWHITYNSLDCEKHVVERFILDANLEKRATWCAASLAPCNPNDGAIQTQTIQSAAWCAASLVRCIPNYAAIQTQTNELAAGDIAKCVIAIERAQLRLRRTYLEKLACQHGLKWDTWYHTQSTPILSLEVRSHES